MTSYAPLPPGIHSRMSGLDVLQEMIAGRLPRAPLAGTLGFLLETAEDGRVTFRAASTDAVLNPAGTTHGGWFGALLDSVMGCAVLSTLPAGRNYTTLEYKVNLIRGIPSGTKVVAEAKATHTGRRTAVATGEIRGASDGKLYAAGSTTCLVMEIRP